MTEPVAPTDPGGGTVQGDPHIVTLDGKRFDFHGEIGKQYTFLTAGDLSVVCRLGGDADATFVDQVTIKVGVQIVIVDLKGIIVNGSKPAEQYLVPGEWVWVDLAGGPRVTVGYNGWLVGVYHDDGTHPNHAGGVLEGVPHLSLSVHCPVQPEWGGVLAKGFENPNAEEFIVQAPY